MQRESEKELVRSEPDMAKSIAAQVAELQRMNFPQLRQKWREFYQEEPPSKSKNFLWRRLSWELQQRRFGGISKKAKARVNEILDECDLRLDLSQPRESSGKRSYNRKPLRDPRLPPPGSTICRTYKGVKIQVIMLDKGFKFEGRTYRSLSRIARELTGTSWNGYLFFDLQKRKKKR